MSRGSLRAVTSSGQVGATDSQRRVWAAGVLATVLSVGTVGYLLLGLDFSDALYQTAVTVTTVGFGEITGGGEPTQAYRWFTLGLVLVGAASVLFAAGVMVEAMVDRRAGVFQEKRMQRDIDKLTGHVIICGYGRVGRAVASRAAGLGGVTVVIDILAEELEACPHRYLVGDATSDEILRAAGIDRAESLVATLASDASNLFLAVSAKQLNPSIRIVSRANATDAANKLRSIDLHTVIEPYEMAGARLATAALRPHTSAYLDQVFSTDSDKVELTEVEIAPGSPLIGERLSEAEAAHRAVVVAYRREGDDEFASPSSFEGTLTEGDVIIVLGDREAVVGLSGRARRSR